MSDDENTDRVWVPDDIEVYIAGRINGSNLFIASFAGDLDIINVEITNNIVNNILINANGINSLTMTDVKAEYNQALNGLHFIGTNNGNVNVNNFMFQYNNDDLSIDGEILILFDSFGNLM